MDSRQINAPERVARTRGQLVDGLRYVWRTPTLATPLVMVAVAGAFAWEFPIALPLMAHGAFGGDAGTYGWMTAAMGVGAVSAGVLGASRRRIRPVSLSRSSVLWRLAIGLACTAPNLPLELVALVLVGYGGISFNAMAKTVLQLAAEPQMRGQIMAIWSVAWGGTSPLGGPLVGTVGQAAGSRWALAVGGGSAVLAGVASYRQLAAAKVDLAKTADLEVLAEITSEAFGRR